MRLVLFTKEYPFGTRETYIKDQLDVLAREFDEVILVPYWIFSEGDHRPIPDNCKLVVPNFPSLSYSDKVRREWMCLGVLIKQLSHGSDQGKHLINLRTFLTQLRTLWSLALYLTRYLGSTQTTFFHDYWMHNGVIIAGFISMLTRKKLHLTCQAHALDLYHSDLKKIHHESESFLPFEAVKLSLIDAVFCISDHGQQFLTKKYPKKAHLFKVLRLGVIDPGRPFSERLIGSKHSLVSCSQLTANKRIYAFPEILSQLHIDYHWYHLGDGDLEQTELLLNEIAKYRLTDRFTLMGWTPNSEVLEFYRNHTVSFFINLSYVEGIPVAMMEAAAFGIPLLGTNTVAVPEIVHPTTGLLIPVEFDPNDCAKQLNEILSKPSTHERLRQGARKMFEENYESNRNFTQLALMIKNQLIR